MENWRSDNLQGNSSRMSHPPNLRGKQIGNFYAKNEDNHQGNSSRRSHPPNLKGREIGLFYAKRGKTERAERKEKDFHHLGPDISLPQKIINKIEEKLTREVDLRYENISNNFEAYFKQTLSTSFEEFLQLQANQQMEVEETYHFDEVPRRDAFEEPTAAPSRQQLSLPVYNHREEILKELSSNRFVLISGDTGCGKTTQIPQMILDASRCQQENASEASYQCGNSYGYHIICTQPRRISAITVAERVASERCERLGRSVGYQIRLESVMPRPRDSILYCTTGVLLRRMESDPLLSNATHVILDEIHERNVESDLLIGLLKIVVKFNKKIKVILMSATFGIEDFAKHFSDCSIIKIQGRLFPVEIKYLEDVLQETNHLQRDSSLLTNNSSFKNNNKPKYFKFTKAGKAEAMKVSAFEGFMNPYARTLQGDYARPVIQAIQNPASEEFNLNLLLDLIFYIAETKPSGAILVFLPGYDKISKVYEGIKKSRNFRIRKYAVFMLHSMMPTIEQKEVFDRPAQNTRKVILATNIAETSITIEDVVYVINSGKIKMKDYDLEKNYQTLEEHFVTLAHSKQRQGRAGRCQPGICYNLYTRAREYVLKDYPLPEIQRTRLEPVILNLKMLKIHDCKDFFMKMISPPQEKAIEYGINLLKRINALDENETLTPLGLHLARLPLDPQIGKMLLISSMFNCLNPMTSISATLSFKDPFYLLIGKEKEIDACKRKFAGSSVSDHLMFAKVMEEFYWAKQDRSEREFCYENFLALPTLKQLEGMKIQLTESLHSAGFIKNSNPYDDDLNRNSQNEHLLRSIIAAGLYPNVAWVKKSKVTKNCVLTVHTIETLDDQQKCKIHPGSINKQQREFDSKYLVYFNLQKSSGVYLYDSTMIYPISLIIFGDRITTGFNELNSKYHITIAAKYRFECDRKTMSLIIKLRQSFETLLQKMALNPTAISSRHDSEDKNLIDALIILFTFETTE